MGKIITGANLTAAAANNNSSSFITSSIIPGANKLILASVINGSGFGAFVPSISGCGLTWVQIATITVNSTVVMTILRAMDKAPTSGVLTISFGGNVNQGIAWSIDQLDGIDTSGTNGSGAIVQSVAGSKDIGVTATGIVLSLAQFQKPQNAAYGGCGMNIFNYGINSGSNFQNLGLTTTNGAPINSQYSQTEQDTVDWIWSSENSIAAAAIALEIKAKQQFQGAMI